jgi:mono/diheme cytochrome c family protein
MTGTQILAVAALVAGAVSVARGDERGSGVLLYRRYCASCHGIGGGGDGPVAPLLKIAPTDLTRLDATIPDLMRQIDGRAMTRAHGTAQMPVWGEVFEGALIAEPQRQRTALQRVEVLADYVKRMQKRRDEGR